MWQYTTHLHAKYLRIQYIYSYYVCIYGYIKGIGLIHTIIYENFSHLFQ